MCFRNFKKKLFVKKLCNVSCERVVGRRENRFCALELSACVKTVSEGGRAKETVLPWELRNYGRAPVSPAMNNTCFSTSSPFRWGGGCSLRFPAAHSGGVGMSVAFPFALTFFTSQITPHLLSYICPIPPYQIVYDMLATFNCKISTFKQKLLA